MLRHSLSIPVMIYALCLGTQVFRCECLFGQAATRMGEVYVANKTDQEVRVAVTEEKGWGGGF